MKPLSFVFAGTSDFSLKCLQILLQSDKFNLKAILTRPDVLCGRGMKKQSSPVKSFAEQKDIPCWTPNKAGDINFLKALSREKCDFSFVCAYGRILPLEYLNLFPKGSFNLHLSLLPLWRGAAPVQRSLLAGERKTGVSLQLMTEELDAGDIIGQREFDVGIEENAGDVFDKALQKTESLLQLEFIRYLEGKLNPYPQDHKKATYAHKIDKIKAEILWKESSIHIHNKVRAFFLGPQAFSFFKGKRIKIFRSRCVGEESQRQAPGKVCVVEKDKVFIVCGHGVLSLLEVQKEGKRKQKIADFLKGNPVFVNDCFG